MVWPSRRCSSLLLLTLSTAAAGVEVKAPAVWTDLCMQGANANATAILRVQNQAGVPVRLVGCSGFEVAAGENASLPLVGLSRFWVAPTNSTIDCHVGPFDDLFYFVADFTGSEAVASIGYGLAHEQPGRGEGKAEGGGTARDGAGAAGGGTGPQPSSSVAGVELTAGPPCTGNCSVRCRVGDCYPNVTVSSMPEELLLTIMGQQASLLSYWHGGFGGHGHGWGHGHGHGWHGHGWGHGHGHGWHGHGGGHHGWGGGGWHGGWGPQ